MSNLTTVRNALAAQIQNYTNPPIQAFGYVPGQINPPCVIVVPSRNLAKYGITLVGNVNTQFGIPMMAPTEFNLDVWVVVSEASTYDRFQATLDQWLGFEYDTNITSIPVAIAKDDTLGGVVSYCEPLTCDSYAPVSWNATTYFGARIHCALSLQ